MFDRRLVSHINWGLLILTAILFLVGVMNLYSASTLRVASGVELDAYFKKQLLWGGAGLCAMTALLLVDYRHLKSVSWPYFFIMCLLVLLVGVSVVGKTIYGAKRWLDLGFFNLQPTELAKIAVLILGARTDGPYGRAIGVGQPGQGASCRPGACSPCRQAA
jgi:rod shape determining protein RodA